MRLGALGSGIGLQEMLRIRPELMLQLMMGLSQVVNGAVAQPEAVAQALIVDARRRLRELQKAAPHVDLSLARVVAWIWNQRASDEEMVAEEGTLQAVLEMCLGLVLRWLSDRRQQSFSQAARLMLRPPCVVDFSLRWSLLPLQLLFRPRSCLIA